MSTLQIPLTSALAAYDQQVQLDGRGFNMRLYFNGRMRAWFVEVRDDAGAIVAPARRCVVDLSLLEQFRYVPGAPAGRLVLWDTTLRHADPTIDDLGARVIAVYVEP